MKKIIILASSNKDKLKEIRDMLPDFDIRPAKEMGFTGEIEETGSTFTENALIKAKAVSTALGLPVLADDSGICVDYLGGAPGIYSARFSQDGNDKSNNALLLSKLKGVKDREAKYVCAMVYYLPNGEYFTSEGETKGEILTDETGTNGFGYDPLFYSYDLDKPMGLATKEEKNSVSHRFRALKEIVGKIK